MLVTVSNCILYTVYCTLNYVFETNTLKHKKKYVSKNNCLRNEIVSLKS